VGAAPRHAAHHQHSHYATQAGNITTIDFPTPFESATPIEMHFSYSFFIRSGALSRPNWPLRFTRYIILCAGAPRILLIDATPRTAFSRPLKDFMFTAETDSACIVQPEN
jgi:hypothetical protein